MDSEYWVSIEDRSAALGFQDLQFDNRRFAIARARQLAAARGSHAEVRVRLPGRGLRLVYAIEANGEVWVDLPDPLD